MAFKIATNVASLNTQRWLGIALVGMNRSLERLSSGYKINRAADDAAGIAIATRLNVKAVSVAKAIDNGNQAIAMLQTAESGIDQIANILTRLKELATQAASDNVSDVDRQALEGERAALVEEIDKIAENTKYGDTALIRGGGNSITEYGTNLTPSKGISAIDVSGANIAGQTAFSLSVEVTTIGSEKVAELTLYGPENKRQVISNVEVPKDLGTRVVNFYQFGIKVTINSQLTDINNNNEFTVEAGDQSNFVFQLGDTREQYDQIQITLPNLKSDGPILKLTGNIENRASAELYLKEVDDAIRELNMQRGKIGAAQNQISYHIANLESMYENTRSAISTIKDADFAREMAEFTKFQIITQSGIAMLAQANQLPQLILALMR
ncbi:MAG: flagellin [Desulfobacterota bacterium]|nr:flagellin [Thermodesulfobacteriota bacterium]